MATPKMPEHIKSKFYYRHYWNELYQNDKGVALLFIGQVGSGKSTGGLKFGEDLDPNFSIERVVNTTKDFLKLTTKGDSNGKLRVGSVILFDEIAGSGEAADARSFLSKTNKFLNYFVTKSRAKKFIIIYAAPSRMQIDSNVRKIGVTSILNFHGIDFKNTFSRATFYWNYITAMTGGQYNPRPLIKVGSGGHYRVSKIRINKPSNELIKAYKKKKMDFIDEDAESMIKQLEKETEKSSSKSYSERIREVFNEAKNDTRLEVMMDNVGEGAVITKLIMDYDVSADFAKRIKDLLKSEYEV